MRIRFRLGDAAATALSKVGITPERVEQWLGRPCRCKERQAKMNAWSDWVSNVLSGKKDQTQATAELEKMIPKEEEKK